jgi:hypothetical protein
VHWSSFGNIWIRTFTICYVGREAQVLSRNYCFLCFIGEIHNFAVKETKLPEETKKSQLAD